MIAKLLFYVIHQDTNVGKIEEQRSTKYFAGVIFNHLIITWITHIVRQPP